MTYFDVFQLITHLVVNATIIGFVLGLSLAFFSHR